MDLQRDSRIPHSLVQGGSSLRLEGVGGIIEPGALEGVRGLRQRLTDEEEAAMSAELSRLRQDHRDLDTAIAALEQVGAPDRLQLQRLKKRKLGLKDRISFIEDQLTPDIIA